MAADGEGNSTSGESEWDGDEEVTDQSLPLWLLPWEQIMCFLSLKDLSSLMEAHSHFYKLAEPRRLRFWQLYFSEISANAGYKKVFKLRFPSDMTKRRIALYWQRLVLAECLKRRGNGLFAAGDFQGARLAFDRALQVTVLRPDKLTKQVSSSILNNRAAACLAAGDFAHAALDAHHATKLRPKFAKAWHNQGRALAQLWYHRYACDAFKELEDLENEAASPIGKVIKLCKSYLDRPNPKHAIFRRSPLQPLLVDASVSPPAHLVFLKAPASHAPGEGVEAKKLQEHHETSHYHFHGEVAEQNVWSFFEALQLRRVLAAGGEEEEPSLLGFVLEPLDLQFEMKTFNHRQEFTRPNHFWDLVWRCSTKRARLLFTALKRAIENFDGDPGAAAPTLVRKIWETQPGSLRDSDHQWMLSQSVPGDKSDSSPFDFEIYASPYALDEEGSLPADRQPDVSSRVSLLVGGALDVAWCKPGEADDTDETDDSYDEVDDPDNVDTPPRSTFKNEDNNNSNDDDNDDEVSAIGKVIVEFVKEEDTIEVAVGRVLMKSLMALRDDVGLHFPRYAVVTNGLDWWFLKIGSRLHVYGVPISLSLADFAPEAFDLKKKSPTMRSLKGIMEWLHLFMSMTAHDNLLSSSEVYDSDMRKLAKTWFAI